MTRPHDPHGLTPAQLRARARSIDRDLRAVPESHRALMESEDPTEREIGRQLHAHYQRHSRRVRDEYLALAEQARSRRPRPSPKKAKKKGRRKRSPKASRPSSRSTSPPRSPTEPPPPPPQPGRRT